MLGFAIMGNSPAIIAERLSRIYKPRKPKKGEPKELLALDQVDLEVRPGELFGVLGPNGAGKTTLIKILTTLLSPSSGKAFVAGFDVATEPEKVRPLINMVSGGESSGYGLLTVSENLWMFSQFYGIPSKAAKEKIASLLGIIGLADRANTKGSELSTGLRQKMNIVRGFMTDPTVLFLDEPTLGLDVGASRDVRSFVRSWVDSGGGRTVLLTTHYMAEADELCDRVAIVNRGRVLACGSPSSLKRMISGNARFEIELSPDRTAGGGADGDEPGPRTAAIAEAIRAIPGVALARRRERPGADAEALELELEAEAALAPAIAELTARGARIAALRKREPSLEEVFVELVGKSMEEVEDAEPAGA
jgi:ABC-2 type transport system ATP-binding protein